MGIKIEVVAMMLLNRSTQRFSSLIMISVTTFVRPVFLPQHHNRFMALFLGPPGEPVPEENFWTLWCKGRLTDAYTQTIRLGTTLSGLTMPTSTISPFSYRPDALPAAKPTVSKH